MPPLPKIGAAALRNLAEELRYAPRAALLKDVARAEALAGDLDEQQAYPADWLVFRITGYRPDMASPPLVSGAEALADLSALVERLSDAAEMAPEELAPGALRIEDLQQRWGVSAKTISRWRRRGLIARRVRDARARSRLAFQPEAVRRFEAARADELAAAGGFRRFTEEEQTRALDAARAAATEGATLNAAARRIATDLGRSHEAVRQLLMRHDARCARDGKSPLFGRTAPPTARDRRLWERAWRRGIDDRDLAARAGRPVASIRRAILEQRADLLRGLNLTPRAPGPPQVPEGRSRTHMRAKAASPRAEHGRSSPQPADNQDPAADPLTPEIVRSDFTCRGSTDLAELVGRIRQTPAPVGYIEVARARAYHHLVARARAGIEALPSQGVSARQLDAIETNLRWAGRLKLELMCAQLRLVGAAAEEAAAAPLEAIPPRQLTPLLLGLIDALSSAVDAHDPFRGGRLAATAGLQLGRAAASLAPRLSADDAGKAARRLAPGVEIPDWTRRACAWWWLEPDPRLRTRLGGLEDRDRALLIARFGYTGAAPMTLDEAAQVAGLTRIQAPRRERAAIRQAMRS